MNKLEQAARQALECCEDNNVAGAILAMREALKQQAECKECGAKQAQIDRLMLEYCPDETTPEQILEWGNNQRPVEQAEQECKDCTSSHPHEEMSKCCELRTEIARLRHSLRVKELAEQTEQEPSKQQEALQELKEWQRAYPLSVFPEPDCTKAQQALESVGMTLDSLSASTLRWALDRVMQIVEEALEQPNCQQLSTSTDNTEHQEPVAWVEVERGIPMFARFADKYKPTGDGFIPLYAAPIRTKDLTGVEDLQDAMTKALKKAFQLGQTYFQQADSESYAANKRADITLELYQKLEDDTRAVIAADREKNK